MQGFTSIQIIYYLQSLVFPFFILEFGKLKYPKPVVFLVCSGTLIAYMHLCWPVWNEILILRAFIYPALNVAIIWLVTDTSPKEKIKLAAMNYLLGLAADLTNTFFSLTFLGITMENVTTVTDGSIRILYTSMFPVFYMTMTSIFLAFYNKIEKKTRNRIVLAMLLLLLTQAFFGVALSQQKDLLSEEAALYGYLCIFMGVVVEYVMFETINSSAAALRDRLELEQEKLQKEMDEKYLRLAEAQEAELSAFRHDFRNQLQVIYSLMEEEPEKAALLLKELEDKMSQQSPKQEGDLK